MTKRKDVDNGEVESEEQSEKKSETKAEKFVRLAILRTGRAVHCLELIAALTGPGYEYSDEQAAQIIKALEDGLQNVKDRFYGKVLVKGGFRFE